MTSRVPVKHRAAFNVALFIAAIVAAAFLNNTSADFIGVGLIAGAAYWWGVSDQYRDTFRRDLRENRNPLSK